MIPFTYLIYCKPTDQYYYGSRYCTGCNPDQLWTTYFTSSKVVKRLIEKYGTDAFIPRITRTFTTPEEALTWETRFLKRVNAVKSDKWLNFHAGDGKFRNKGGYTLSEETKHKMRKPKSDEHKQKLKGNTNWRHTDYSPKHQCIHCGKFAMKTNITRWHNENCKQKP